MGWSGIKIDGKELPFSKDNVKALYGRADLPWIKDQVDDFIADRSNFMMASPDYVRRVDLDGHVNQLRENMKAVRDETREGTRETNKRLDQVLAVLAQDKK